MKTSTSIADPSRLPAHGGLRRRLLAASLLAPAMAVGPGVLAAETLRSLRKSPRMPVLFLGHGSPMNAIGDNAYRRSWQALGAEFGARYPTPQLILCISAHWLTRGGAYLTGSARPKTIHDFGGFPQELFDQQYPAPGAPAAAAEIARTLRQAEGRPAGLDPGEGADGWGLDHGCWSVLKPMFPRADIPVVQLSMDYGRPPAEHWQLGQQLQGLRERGVLIVGSGNIVHNLRATRRGTPADQAYDWALEFDRVVGDQLARGDLAALADFRRLGALAAQAHPTHDHYLPLLYAAGAVEAGRESPRFFNSNFQSASISMRSVVWG